MNTINSFKKNKQQGLTLIEASMVLALSAVVVAVAMYYYNAASENNKLQATEAEILSIEQKILQLYDANQIYNTDSLSDQVIIAAGGIPKAYIRNATKFDKHWTGIVDPFNGNVVVAPTAEAGATYFIWTGSIPTSACTQILTYNYGSSLGAIKVTNNSLANSNEYGTMYKNGPKHSGIYVTEPVKAANQICNKAAANEKSGMIGLAFLYKAFYKS